MMPDDRSRRRRDHNQRQIFRRLLLIYAAVIAFVAVFAFGWSWWRLG